MPIKEIQKNLLYMFITPLSQVDMPWLDTFPVIHIHCFCPRSSIRASIYPHPNLSVFFISTIESKNPTSQLYWEYQGRSQHSSSQSTSPWSLTLVHPKIYIPSNVLGPLLISIAIILSSFRPSHSDSEMRFTTVFPDP